MVGGGGKSNPFEREDPCSWKRNTFSCSLTGDHLSRLDRRRRRQRIFHISSSVPSYSLPATTIKPFPLLLSKIARGSKDSSQCVGEVGISPGRNVLLKKMELPMLRRDQIGTSAVFDILEGKRLIHLQHFSSPITLKMGSDLAKYT